jgi:hypothetical protein
MIKINIKNQMQQIFEIRESTKYLLLNQVHATNMLICLFFSEVDA